MLNLWIGLCNGDRGLPQQIHKLGYRHKFIEWDITGRAKKTVTPDLIIASEEAEHAALLEFKSGANSIPGQLQRYAALTPDDLREKAFIPGRVAARHDLVVVGKDEHVDRLKLGMDEEGVKFPLLAVNAKEVRLGSV